MRRLVPAGREDLPPRGVVALEPDEAATVAPARFPDCVYAGIGTTESPDRSWQEARTALRFTTARRPVVHHNDVGGLALLAPGPPSPPA
ncbi:hypothetical protein [Streptomyces sp. YGL11-2]|uniref:hypothetical protein n=1 Tax=Streptomyces sp. YGL11-2 TaxID=3414028 RepID=UPI003CECB9ED